MVDVAEHIGLARHLAKKLRWERDDPDELFGIAMLALTRAGMDYDPSIGEFKACAAAYIRRAIRTHHRDQHVPMRDRRRTVPITEAVELWYGGPGEAGFMERADAQRDAQQRVAELTRGLPPEYAELALLRAAGVPCEEAGRMLGVSKERARQIETVTLRHARERAGVACTDSIARVQARAKERWSRIRPTRRDKTRPYLVGA
jgi:RNA polymerase sigma factor (sigma-70 family)